MLTPQIMVQQVMPPPIRRQVAVIGAGAAGLVAAREMKREGHKVVVFERDKQVGGTWVYTQKSESDPLGLDPNRELIHTSLYESLRTNLPREAMGFRDFPFVRKDTPGRDARRFPGHREVLMYLKDFAVEFGIEEMVRFECEVVKVGLLAGEEDGKWEVRWKRTTGGGCVEGEVFDAVVVCNGHYAEPRLADFPGITSWPGKQMHSHNYRIPEPFRDQIVILIGGSASAVDISRDITRVAKEVHVAIRSIENGQIGKQPGYDNMWLHSMIEIAQEDGTVIFKDGSTVRADIIMHCTGYKYRFPFLETNGLVSVDDNRVGPLYKHIFPPALAPWLSFVGLTWKLIPFYHFELQCKWIAGVLSGRILLPSQKEMMEDVEAFYSELEAAGKPKRYTHSLDSSQFEYNDWLAAQCGCWTTEEWRMGMYAETSVRRRIKPETYRDEWDDDHLILQAHEDFAKYSVTKR